MPFISYLIFNYLHSIITLQMFDYDTMLYAFATLATYPLNLNAFILVDQLLICFALFQIPNFNYFRILVIALMQN